MLQNVSTYPELDAPAMRRWLAALVATLAPGARSLGVRWCGERAMRAMNRDFRGRDSVTDVLSFPGAAAAPSGQASPSGGPPDPARRPAAIDDEGHLGDVVICVPQARRQARASAQPLEREMRRLLLHGVLHCMGHDHETDGGEMERLERALRRRWLERS